MEKSGHHKGDVGAGNAVGPVEPGWRRLLRQAITDPDELCALLALPDEVRAGARASAKLFPLLVPRGFAALMRPGDAADPLLRQVLPLAEEGVEVAGWTDDPLAEAGCTPQPGLLHKYHGRVLLVTTGACAVHCRYCFRRHFPYGSRPRGPRWWSGALAYVAAHPDVEEVILSGGDPLTLPDVELAAIAQDLAAIPHLRRLRVHSRLPVVLPERVDDGLLAWFARTRLSPVLVLHANHPRELSPAVSAACARLADAGVTLLNQSVLLRGVNDRADVLEELSRRLLSLRVLPYYLHQMDRVRGAAHHAVADDEAHALVAALAARLPGYLVPRLAREEPGMPAKTVLR